MGNSHNQMVVLGDWCSRVLGFSYGCSFWSNNQYSEHNAFRLEVPNTAEFSSDRFHHNGQVLTEVISQLNQV
jgi:hypothetical protein